METKLMKILSRESVFLGVLLSALFAPLFFHGPRFGMPRVKGGDEPHYLVMLHSLLSDGDFDVKNNYDSVWEGGFQAGKKFAGFTLDPHAAYLVGGQWIDWWNIYEDFSKWKRGTEGSAVPLFKPGMDRRDIHAFPMHPVGTALFLGCFLWPLRGTIWVEPASLLAANLLMILSALIFRRVILRLSGDGAISNVSTLLVFLCTPLWTYGRTLFTEPFLVFFGLAAFWFALEKKRGLAAGGCLGLGMLMKPVLVVLVLPLAALWWLRKDRRNFLLLGLGPLVSGLMFLYLDNLMFGSPFHSPQPFVFGNPLKGAAGLTLSWNHGLLAFSPVVLPLLFSWKKFLGEKGLEAAVWGSGFILYFLVMALWKEWSGDWCFGPRLIVPVIPFLMMPAWYTLGAFPGWKPWKKWAFLALVMISFLINALGAMDGYWDSHPLTILKGNIS